jgi:hypothetical protein
MSSYPRAIIPASPGWYRACFFVRATDPSDDTPPFVDLHPVIAWHVDLETGVGEILPITSAGLGRPSADQVGFKRPDGNYEVDGETYDTEAEALGALKRQFDRIRRVK